MDFPALRGIDCVSALSFHPGIADGRNRRRDVRRQLQACHNAHSHPQRVRRSLPVFDLEIAPVPSAPLQRHDNLRQKRLRFPGQCDSQRLPGLIGGFARFLGCEEKCTNRSDCIRALGFVQRSMSKSHSCVDGAFGSGPSYFYRDGRRGDVAQLKLDLRIVEPMAAEVCHGLEGIGAPGRRETSSHALSAAQGVSSRLWLRLLIHPGQYRCPRRNRAPNGVLAVTRSGAGSSGWSGTRIRE